MHIGHRIQHNRASRLLVIAGVSVLRVATAARAEMRVAGVDRQSAVNGCDARKKAKDQVRGKFEKAQNELKKEREDLDKARDDFERKSITMKEDDRRDRERELENRTLDFKRKYGDMQRDLKRTDAELTSGIVEQLYGIVSD